MGLARAGWLRRAGGSGKIARTSTRPIVTWTIGSGGLEPGTAVGIFATPERGPTGGRTVGVAGGAARVAS